MGNNDIIMSTEQNRNASFLSKRPKQINFLQKLHLRQIRGEIKTRRNGFKLRFFNQLPQRLAFPLEFLAPLSALNSGHVFLGFTKCGQFVLSYTSSVDTDEVTLQASHRYRLHWWLIVPYLPLRKVAEVLLFTDQDIHDSSYDSISITICQWPNDLTKILVYGCSIQDDVVEQAAGGPSNRRCYLTITAVPALNRCNACFQVASSYEEEEVAERWNSCVRLSCLLHGYTVHTSFDMVPPYPRFLPQVQLKYRDWVVLNAGNFIHVLRVSLENTHSKSLHSQLNALYQCKFSNGLRTEAEEAHATFPTVRNRQRSDASGTSDVHGSTDELEDNSVHSVRNFEKLLSPRNSASTSSALYDARQNSSITINWVSSSRNVRSKSVALKPRLPVCDETGESSSSDTELENVSRLELPVIDRRRLSEADRDREWEILVSSVARVDSEHCNASGAFDTDSDIELCANDSSGHSDSSTCTVKDMSKKFNLLKPSDTRTGEGDCSSNSISLEASEHILANIRNETCAASHTLLMTRPVYLLSPPRGLLPLGSCCSPSLSNDVTSCNDDSDDSSVFCTPLVRNNFALYDRHQSPVCSVSSSSHRLMMSPSREQMSPVCTRSRVFTPVSTRLSRSHSEDCSSLSTLRSGRLLRHSSDNSADSLAPSSRAENEYEFIDEIAGSRHEKLSVFRKRRLADKKYEFSDENSENVPANYRSFRKNCRHSSAPLTESVLLVPSPAVSPHDFHSSGRSYTDTGGADGFARSVFERLLSPNNSDVLRPINQNISSPLLSPRDDRWLYDWDAFEKNVMPRCGSRELGLSPSYSTQASVPPLAALSFPTSGAEDPQNLNCVVDINRCYIEVDDELVSIITDIEDDELSNSTGYHNALPLEVHGAGYTQMNMISNTKAEKLVMPCVRVRQLSLDVEQFCHAVAHSLCLEAGKLYSCCSDYNVEIVDVCSNTGNIVAVASLLVQADNVSSSPTKGRKRGPVTRAATQTALLREASHTAMLREGRCLGVRRVYQATSTFVFNIKTKQHYVIDTEPLQEKNPLSLTCHEECDEWCSERWWWQSGSALARQLRALSTLPTSYYSSVKVLSNQPVLRGNSLTHIMEAQHLLAIVMRTQCATV